MDTKVRIRYISTKRCLSQCLLSFSRTTLNVAMSVEKAYATLRPILPNPVQSGHAPKM